jgi:hypothetical protein
MHLILISEEEIILMSLNNPCQFLILLTDDIVQFSVMLFDVLTMLQIIESHLRGCKDSSWTS